MIAEDLAGLVDQLALLVGVVVAVREAARLGKRVEGDLVWVDGRHRLLAVEHRARLAEQLVDRGLAGAGDRLVGRDHEALDPRLVVEWLQGDDHLHRRAVRVGDDPAVPLDRVGVDLGDDQRHVVVHAEMAGVVDDDGARLDQLRRPLGADRSARRGEDDVEALDRVLAERTALERRAVPIDLPAGRALGGEGNQLADREAALGKDTRGSWCRPARSHQALRLCTRRRSWTGLRRSASRRWQRLPSSRRARTRHAAH